MTPAEVANRRFRKGKGDSLIFNRETLLTEPGGERGNPGDPRRLNRAGVSEDNLGRG